MTILVIKVPQKVLEEACVDPSSSEAYFVESLKAEALQMLEEDKGCFIIPNHKGYDIEVEEGEGIIEVKVEVSTINVED